MHIYIGPPTDLPQGPPVTPQGPPSDHRTTAEDHSSSQIPPRYTPRNPPSIPIGWTECAGTIN